MQASSIKDVINFDPNLAKAIYNLGHSLIQDDKADIGWMTYRNRHNHIYHGKKSPDHLSPFHHYQVGSLLCMLAQFMSIGALAQDVYDTPADEDNTVS
jgi:hypothetical protein